MEKQQPKVTHVAKTSSRNKEKYNRKKNRKRKVKRKVMYVHRKENKNHPHHSSEELVTPRLLLNDQEDMNENKKESSRYEVRYETSPRHHHSDIRPGIKNLTWRVIKEPHDWYKHTIKLLKQTTLNKNLFELYCWAARASEKNSKLSPKHHSKGRKKTQFNFDQQHGLSVEGHHLQNEPSHRKEHTKEESNLLEMKLKKVTRGRWKTPGEIAILVGRERNKQKTSQSDIPLTLQCFASEMQKVWRTTATTSNIPYHNSKMGSLPRTLKQQNSNPKVYHPETGEIVRLSQLLHHKSKSNTDVESNLTADNPKVSTDLKSTYQSVEDLEHYLAVNQYIDEYVDSSRSVETKHQTSDELFHKKNIKKQSKRIPPGQGRLQSVSRYSKSTETLPQIINVSNSCSSTTKSRAVSKMRYESVLNNQLKVTSVSITPVPPCPPPCSPCKSYSSFVQKMSPLDDQYLLLPPIERVNSPPPGVDSSCKPPQEGKKEYIIFHSEEPDPPVTPRAPTRLTLRLPRLSISCSGEDDTQTDELSRKESADETFLPPVYINRMPRSNLSTPTDSGIITPLNTPHSSCSSIDIETDRRKPSSVKLPDIKVHLAV